MATQDLKALYQRRLTVPGLKDGIRQSLYDFQSYAAAGQTQLRFFSVPAGGAKTLADTNMKLAGQLMKGWKFICESIEVHIYPGSSAGSYVAQKPVQAGTALAAPNFANDIWVIGQSGWLELMVGTRPYLDEAPLLRFPPKTGPLLQTAMAVENTNTAVANQLTVDYARFGGRPYVLNPTLPLEENTAFEVTMNWPTAVAPPSGFVARIGVVLDGILFRNG